MDWIILISIGLLAGTIGAMAGLGGGIIVVPALLLIGAYTHFFEGITPQIAVGTSLVVMIFTGLSSTLSYLKHKTVDYKSGLLFFIGSGPGSILGAWMNKYVHVQAFNIYFGGFIIFIALLLIFRNQLKPFPVNKDAGIQRTFTDNTGKTFEYGFRPSVAITISLVVGFISGLFGVGGGSLMVPVMILLFMFPPHVATATSMFMVLLSAITSSGTHIYLGNVDWMYAIALIPGAWFGAKFGSYINMKLQSNTLVSVLRVILIIVGAHMIYQGITG